jgi:hypothetical protein
MIDGQEGMAGIGNASYICQGDALIMIPLLLLLKALSFLSSRPVHCPSPQLFHSKL